MSRGSRGRWMAVALFRKILWLIDGLMALMRKGRAEAQFKMPTRGYCAGALPLELARASKNPSK